MGEGMAEVRKKSIEDKYNTSKIKKSNIVSKPKKSNNEKNETKKQTKIEKATLVDKFKSFCHGVKLEFTRVHWTSKKDMIKYSIACIFFIIFCSLFFYLIDVLFALVRSLFS